MGLSNTHKRVRAIYRHHTAELAFSVDYDQKQLHALVTASMGKPCPYCGRLINGHNFSIDHKKPICRYGDRSLFNLEVICDRCNRMKGSLDDNEFFAFMMLMKTIDPKASANLLERLHKGSG